MDTFEQLAQRVTQRLACDPELRRDVKREIEGHLQDAAREFRRGGMAEDEAAASAVKALGDQTQLADSLWQANRLRMRWRSVAKWTARAALLPGAIVVIALLVSGLRPGLLVASGGLSDGPEARRLKPGTDAYLLVYGKPEDKTQLDAARSRLERWPNDPVIYADYIRARLSQPILDSTSEQIDTPVTQPATTSSADRPRDPPTVMTWRIKDKALWQEVMADLDRGEQIDPQNAFYNLQKAAMLILPACRLADAPDVLYSPVSWTRKPATSTSARSYASRITVTDQAMFERGLVEWNRALAKPCCTSRVLEIVQRRHDALGRPVLFADLVHQTSLDVGTLVPPLNDWRNLARCMAGEALVLAEASRSSKAQQKLEEVHLLATKMGVGSQILIQLLAATAIDALALKTASIEMDGGKLWPEGAAEAGSLQQFVMELRQTPSEVKAEQAGMFDAIILPSLPGYRKDLGPMRRVEYTLYDRMIVLGACTLLGVFGGLLTLVGGLFLGFCRSDKPLLLFVGWRSIGVILASVAGVLLLYGAYAYLSPWSGREYGLSYMRGRMVAEALGVILVVLTVAIWQAGRAVKRVERDQGMIRPDQKRPFFGNRLYRRTAIRSVAPVLLGVVIVTATVLGGMTLWAEAAAMRQVDVGYLSNEIEGSAYRLLRERYAQQHAQMMQQRCTPAAEATGGGGM